MKLFDTSILEKLVNINSQTQDIPGVQRAQNYLESILSDLGMKVEWHQNKVTSSADALVASIGSGPYVVTFLGHVDTVAKGGEFFPFQNAHDGLLQGAGIADMKGGLAIMLEALKRTLSNLGDGLTFNVVISPNEELGSTGFHELFAQIGKKSDLILCFEPALEDGSFIGGRNGNRWYDFTFKGEKLHTGRAPKGSPNVLHQICELQNILTQFISKDSITKFNFTSITCDNEKYNVSSSLASAKMDLRFATTEERDGVHQKIISWGQSANISFEHSISDDCPPLANTKGDDIVNELRQKLEKAEMMPIFCSHCEGASDANYFSSASNVVLDGLGPRGDYFHSRKEYIVEASLENRCHALVEFLNDLSKKHSSTSESKNQLAAAVN